MKYLLNGVAFAAVLAVAAPVWAQSAPAAPSAGAPHAAVHAATKPAKAKMRTKATARPHHQRATSRHTAARRHHVRRAHGIAAGNRITEELNREELARIHAGSAPAAPPASKK